MENGAEAGGMEEACGDLLETAESEHGLVSRASSLDLSKVLFSEQGVESGYESVLSHHGYQRNEHPVLGQTVLGTTGCMEEMLDMPNVPNSTGVLLSPGLTPSRSTYSGGLSYEKDKDYDVVHSCCRSGQGDVVIIQDKTTKAKFAKKEPTQKAEAAQHHRKEAKAMLAVQTQSSGNHVLQLQGFLVQPSGQQALLTHALDGDIEKICCHDPTILRIHMLDFTYKVCSGLRQMHSNGLLHRDIKPKNILIAFHPTGMQVQICDLGSHANMVNAEMSDKPWTLEYSSPEFAKSRLLKGKDLNQARQSKAQLGTAADCHSLVLSLMHVVLGTHWYSEILQSLRAEPGTTKDIVQRKFMRIIQNSLVNRSRHYIAYLKQKLGQPLGNGISPHYITFLLRCLAEHPSDRPSAQQMMNMILELDHMLSTPVPANSAPGIFPLRLNDLSVDSNVLEEQPLELVQDNLEMVGHAEMVDKDEKEDVKCSGSGNLPVFSPDGLNVSNENIGMTVVHHSPMDVDLSVSEG